MIKRIRLYSILSVLFIVINAFSLKDNPEPVRILLMGDSTTEGGSPVFERSIEQILASDKDIPPIEVINVGKGGETAYSLLNSGRYDREIKDIESVDYIFFRYGINDWIKRKPFEVNFPQDMTQALDRLQEDFPEAQIILMTIIPFINETQDQIINSHIIRIAKQKNLELFDIYPAYKKQIEKFGKNSMTVRFFPLNGIPENYHELLAPYTKFYEWKDDYWIRVQSNEFDPLFSHIPGWFKDKHPNTTGYRFIADQTAKYILPRLKNQ